MISPNHPVLPSHLHSLSTDPNTKRFKRTFIYYDMDTQYASSHFVSDFFYFVQSRHRQKQNTGLILPWSVSSQVIFVMGCISYSDLTYKRKTVLYEYPGWAIGIGWTLAFISVIFIPIVMVFRILTTSGSLSEVGDSYL